MLLRPLFKEITGEEWIERMRQANAEMRGIVTGYALGRDQRVSKLEGSITELKESLILMSESMSVVSVNMLDSNAQFQYSCQYMV